MRYYDPGLGRFISPDTIVPGAGPLTVTPNDTIAASAWAMPGGGPGNPQELNRYSYALNNPLRYADPTGHCIGVLAGVDTLACLAIAGAVLVAGSLVAVNASSTAAQTSSGVAAAPMAEQLRDDLTPFWLDAAMTAGPELAETLVHAAAGDEETADAGEPASTPRGGTYVLKDPVTGKVVRTGRTGDLAQRRGQHAHDPELKDYEFEEDARTDDYAEQRGREQYLHDKYHPPLNKIRPINPANPNYQRYIDAAKNVKGRH